MSRYMAARGCDTTTVRHDTTRGAAIRAAQRVGASVEQRTRARGDTAEGAYDTADTRPRHNATTSHDTAQCALPGPNARCLGTMRASWAQCARPVRTCWVQGVHLVYPT